MKLLLTIISFSLLLSQQLQVDGNLKVTGEIDAQGQAIKNVGVPQSATDAVNLATAQGLAGMKPERIYHYYRDISASFNFVVPENKVWKILAYTATISSSPSININGDNYFLGEVQDSAGPIEIWALNGAVIENNGNDYRFSMTIFEYSIQSSGTDQGMDYIVP